MPKLHWYNFVSVVLLPIASSITLEVGTMVKLYAFHQQQLETFFEIFVILQHFLEENYQQTSLWITSMDKLTRNYPKLYLHLQSERKRKAERSMFYQHFKSKSPWRIVVEELHTQYSKLDKKRKNYQQKWSELHFSTS